MTRQKVENKTKKQFGLETFSALLPCKRQLMNLKLLHSWPDLVHPKTDRTGQSVLV